MSTSVVATGESPAAGGRGWPYGSATNRNVGERLSTRENSIPVLLYWFDTQTYGTRPVKSPAPPRSSVVRSPLASQLNPMRGEKRRLPLGTSEVLSPMEAKVESNFGLSAGLSGNVGSSRKRGDSLPDAKPTPTKKRFSRIFRHTNSGNCRNLPPSSGTVKSDSENGSFRQSTPTELSPAGSCLSGPTTPSASSSKEKLNQNSNYEFLPHRKTYRP